MFEKIIEKKNIKYYNPGEIIKNQGNRCTEMGILVSGELKISTITNSDKEELISTIYPNDCFGDLLIFEKNNFYLGDIIAVKKSGIIFMNKQELLQYLSNDLIFLESFLKRITHKAYLIKQQNKLLAHKNIRDRILYDINFKKENNEFKYKSIAGWARELSIPRESLSREITKMVNDGIIKKQNKIIYLKEESN